MPTEGFWAEALERAPIVVITLSAFIFLAVKAMKFFEATNLTFMQHQEKRDRLFADTLMQIGQACHDEASQRQSALTEELQATRAIMEKVTSTHAKYEQTMERVAAALERSA